MEQLKQQLMTEIHEAELLPLDTYNLARTEGLKRALILLLNEINEPTEGGA